MCFLGSWGGELIGVRWLVEEFSTWLVVGWLGEYRPNSSNLKYKKKSIDSTYHPPIHPSIHYHRYISTILLSPRFLVVFTTIHNSRLFSAIRRKHEPSKSPEFDALSDRSKLATGHFPTTILEAEKLRLPGGPHCGPCCADFGYPFWMDD